MTGTHAGSELFVDARGDLYYCRYYCRAAGTPETWVYLMATPTPGSTPTPALTLHPVHV